MKKIAIYTRVSTGYQVDKDSLPYQRQECTNYAKMFLHAADQDLEVFEDAGKSGKNTTDRPAFNRMMQAVKAGIVGKVIVLKIDRISRNLVDFSLMYDTFRKYDVTFISLNEQFDTGSAMGEAMLKIILVFAELERKMTSERVTGVMIGRAKAGEWNGARMPFGWEWDPEIKKPVHHPVEGPIVVQMYDLYLKHHSSCWLRDFLNKNDIRTKRGGEWTSKTVSDIIRNPLNKGDYRYNYRLSARGKKKSPEEMVYIEGLYDPLVPPPIWEECCRIMDKNQRGKNLPGQPRHQAYPHVFSGLVWCGKCGNNFCVSRLDKMRNNGFQPSMYICSRRYRKRACDERPISDVIIGPFVINYIAAISKAAGDPQRFRSAEELEKFLLSAPEFSNIVGIETKGLEETYRLLTAGASGSWSAVPVKGNASTDQRKEDELKSKIQRCERALERLKKAFLFSDDGMSEKEFLELRAEIEQERVSASNDLQELRTSEFTTITDEAAFFKSASGFLLAHHLNTDEHIIYSELAPIVDPEILRDFFRSVVSRIYVHDAHVEKIVFKNGVTHTFLYR